MFRPIYIDSSQVLCACQGPFKEKRETWLNSACNVAHKELHNAFIDNHLDLALLFFEIYFPLLFLVHLLSIFG